MEGISKRLGQGFLALTAAVALLNAGPSNASTKRYIVSFKSTPAFQMQSQAWKQSKYLKELGLQKGESRFSKGFGLLGTSAQIEQSLEHLDMMIVNIDRPEVADQLKRHPAILDVEQEVFFPAPRPVNKSQSRINSNEIYPMRAAAQGEMDMPWGISAVKADRAWSVTRGQGAKVVVLDTGIDEAHPDLKSRFVMGKNFTNQGGASAYTDDIGHGTHVAGTIAADGNVSGLVGVAPRADILAGKVCAANGCSSAAIVAGINWGVDQKADVISMSLGGPLGLPSQKRAVERAENENVIVVAASGNGGNRMISYPAAHPTAIAVGAVAQAGQSYKRADFSQYGPGLDVVAPGVDVVSSVPRGAGRVTTVMVDLGDGKSTRIKSAGLQGAHQNSHPVVGELVPAGLGKSGDFTASVRGKVALIQRGEITFREKVENALKNGAIAVMIYNNADGLARGGLGDATISIPVAMIERAAGEQIRLALSQGKRATGSVVTEQSDYDSYDGTSMATPHVAGVVALLRATNKNLSPAQVRDILARTATQLGSVDEYGAGMVDAEKAVFQAKTLGLLPVAQGF